MLTKFLKNNLEIKNYKIILTNQIQKITVQLGKATLNPSRIFIGHLQTIITILPLKIKRNLLLILL